MSLADRMTRTPLPHDREAGREAAARLEGAADELRDLVTGAAGSSPHLARLIAQEAAWLPGAAAAPEDALAAAMPARDPEIGRAALAATLRQAKRRVGLLTALADLGGVWDLDTVTGALSDLADACLGAGIAALVAEAQAAGRLPATDAPDGGLFVLAMGKLGARELNYSSDIDLIALFDEGRYDQSDYAAIRKQFIRIVQALTKLLTEETGEGYVFRVDLRLRPDPSVTPVCIGLGAAERYYESHGRTWERAALIRARPAAGDTGAAARLLDDLAPFIWRRHLDFAAIEDAHAMRRRIARHKGLTGPFRLPGHNVKLGRGGIREIEFFIQTKQLICGGRDPSLREPRTLPALRALVDAGWVPAEPAGTLADTYVAHRTLEHRLQMVEDQQSHTYPTAEGDRARIAALSGADDLQAFEDAQSERFLTVHAIAERFFAAENGGAQQGGADEIWERFPDPARTRALVAEWPRLPALRSERAQRLFDRLAPRVAEGLLQAARPDLALLQFDRFLRGLPAGVQVFSLFEANPQILDLLIDICATAPRLAEYLGRNAPALDAVLGPSFFEPLGTAAELTEELRAALADAEDYERVLDAARIWAREQRFRAGVQLLRRIAGPEETGAAFAAIADAVLTALLPHVVAEHATKHGDPPGRGLAVIAMGKLGSAEMTASSDLDLIVVYDADPGDASQGRRPLSAAPYYARLTQAMIAALSAPTAEGALYEIDMRLRPSGRQGPVATALSSFATYQAEEAWTWERLALTRARVVAGDEGVREAVGAALAEARSAPRPADKVLVDARDMRRRLLESWGSAEDPWAIKRLPGRMLDIELMLQTGCLLHPGIETNVPREMIPALRARDWLTTSEARHLSAALGRLQALQQVARVALEGRFDPERGGPGLAELAAVVAGEESIDALRARLEEDSERSAAIIARRLGGEQGA